MTHDVRAIANFVLDFAERAGRPMSNMQINKIVYFLHADYLASFGRPLVGAKIEAWDHGPVFRELYHTFKPYGDRQIDSRATRLDPQTGDCEVVSYKFSEDELAFLQDSAGRYSKMSAAALRALSHVPGGPWDQVWNHQTETHATMRITDDSILDWYRSAKH